MCQEAAGIALCESVSRPAVWKDTSIRLMILWHVLRVSPSNLISFPEDETH